MSPFVLALLPAGTVVSTFWLIADAVPALILTPCLDHHIYVLWLFRWEAEFVAFDWQWSRAATDAIVAHPFHARGIWVSRTWIGTVDLESTGHNGHDLRGAIADLQADLCRSFWARPVISIRFLPLVPHSSLTEIP